MSNYKHLMIAVPLSVLDAMNRIAVIIDPEEITPDAFYPNASVDGSLPQTHAMQGVPTTLETIALVKTKDPDQWFAALTQMAIDRGRDAPIYQDCVDVAAVIELDDEVTVQEAVEVEPVAFV